MSKNVAKTLLLTAVLAFSGIPASAQGLSGLFNKAKKTSEKVEKVLSKPSTNTKPMKATAVIGVALDNGITISNPLAEAMEIVPVGLYGVSTSENFGNCYLVIKVKMLLPESKTNFGSVGSERMIAVDTNGKTYTVDAEVHIPTRLLRG